MRNHTKADPRIIIALDLNNISEVRDLIKKVGDSVSTFKVGLRLFTKYGPDLVNELRTKGYEIFLDLKYHDIPNTVKTACKEAVQLGVKMLTVHCMGGSEMCRAAVEGVKEGVAEYGQKAPVILGVTVLTSMDETSLRGVGINKSMKEQVLSLAGMAVDQGINGIVCSPLEVEELKSKIGRDFVAVTPGIRMASGSNDDQKRVATPQNALLWGADYLVVGRAVYAADDPVSELNKIYESIN